MITLRVLFTDGLRSKHTLCDFSIDYLDDSTVSEFAQQYRQEIGNEWMYDGYEFVSSEYGTLSPDHFGNLEDWSDYANDVRQYGNGFDERFKDTCGHFDFCDENMGMFSSVQDFYFQCYEPYYVEFHDLLEPTDEHDENELLECMTEYDFYFTAEGVHVFTSQLV